MNEDSIAVELSTFCVVSLVVVVFILIVLFQQKSKPTKKRRKEEPVSDEETYEDGLTIHNYLEKPLKVLYISADGKSMKALHDYVKPEMSTVIPWSNVTLERGGRLRFLATIGGDNAVRMFRDYPITNPKSTTDVHVGMVSSAMLHYLSPVVFGGGSHEITNLWIHNEGDIPLNFNDHIHVPPRTTIKYDGTGSFAPSGISIGTTLHNDDNYYSDFRIDRKMSDVYYGIVSNAAVPLYRGNAYPPELTPTA